MATPGRGSYTVLGSGCMGDVNERDPGLPIKLEPCSNTEYDPPPMPEVTREAIRRARRLTEENARKLGLPRREFLLSSMGAATTLAVLSACSDDSGTGSGGSYDVPEEATVDPDAALETLRDAQPVIDVQTHLLEYPEDMVEAGYIADLFAGQRDCGDLDPNDCFRTDRWLEEIFDLSQTTMAVISSLPNPPGDDDPLSPEHMDQAREQLEQICDGEARVLVQGHGQPNFGDLEAFFDQMEEETDTYNLAAWKSYTHVGSGWSLDDSDQEGDPIGEAYLSKIEELHADGRGPDILCVHKGFSMVGTADPRFALANDVGTAARNHPDLRLCIYHSGYEPGVEEGPYDPDDPNDGIDLLLKSLQDNDIGPGSNVYAELGTTWRNVMTENNLDQAAHVLGKLLLHVGEDRILWGTDSIWYGSPQDQIDALRAFEISEQFQNEYGYPALTEDIKHKIFWRNAAQLHGIDTYRLECDVADPGEVEEARRSTQLGNWTYGPRSAAMSRRAFFGSHPWAVR